MASSSTASSAPNIEDPEELTEIMVPAKPNNKGLATRSLVGKICSDKELNRNVVKEILNKTWGMFLGFHMTDLGRNMFLFSFSHELHSKEVMAKAPWYVMNQFLSLQFWLPEVPTYELDFLYNSFWVQVQNLPLENLIWQNAATLLKKMGDVLEIEEPVVERRVIKSFIKARVRLDISKSFPVGCWVPRVDLPKFWVIYRYERLQGICYNCGVLGHEQKQCKRE